VNLAARRFEPSSPLLLLGAALVCALLLPSTARAQEYAGPVAGLGAKTCTAFLDQLAEEDAADALYFSWAEGFVTATAVHDAAAGQKAADLKIRSKPEQKIAIGNYCTRNPDALFWKAAEDVYKKMLKKTP